MADNDIQGQIKCSFPNESALYMAYMPYVKGGGLFIRTKQTFELGTKINLSVTLMDEEAHQVKGKVVWLTPSGAQRNKPAGIGVQLLDEAGLRLTNIIETHLAGMLKSSQMTDSM